jgi:class 3 adenylate cyclase
VSARPTTTVLFTDIVGSTELAVALGDAKWAELLERHHAVVRRELRRFGGEEMDTAGDGFFAVFGDAGAAIACACAVRAAVQELGVDVRCGVHTGDCWIAEAKCAGSDVHVGARIAARAHAGEVLVSRASAEAAGAAFALSPIGEFLLKGIPGPVELLAVDCFRNSARARSG